MQADQQSDAEMVVVKKKGSGRTAFHTHPNCPVRQRLERDGRDRTVPIDHPVVDPLDQCGRCQNRETDSYDNKRNEQPCPFCETDVDDIPAHIPDDCPELGNSSTDDRGTDKRDERQYVA